MAKPAPQPPTAEEPGPGQNGQPAVIEENPVVETWIPLGRWCKQKGLPEPSRLSTGSPPSYVLTMPGGVLTLRLGSRLAQWSGLEVWLAFPPQLLNGQPCVHGLDLEKTLEPLAARRVAGFPATKRTIVIDPGHGGTDSGTSSVLAIGSEKEFTLDWAQRLGRLLAARGWQVWLTRNGDVNMALADRVAFAAARQAEVFVSLHFNSSAPDHEQSGLETYCLTPAAMPSNVTRGFTDELTLICPNNAFDAQNFQLALGVHQALLEVNGHHDRGVRRARFPGVLRGQERPAVLIEGGYLSNSREARLIADPAYRQKLAEAVAGALTQSPLSSLKSKLQVSQPSLQPPGGAELVQTNASP